MVEKVQKGGVNKPQKKRQMFIELSGKNIAITTFNLRAATEALHMLECIFVIVRFLSLLLDSIRQLTSFLTTTEVILLWPQKWSLLGKEDTPFTWTF